jgi:hypothetical protein
MADKDKPLFDRVHDKIQQKEKEGKVGPKSEIEHGGLGTGKGGGNEPGGPNDDALKNGQKGVVLQIQDTEKRT